MESGEPDWLPEIIARYNLTPPPAPGQPGADPAGESTKKKGVGLTVGPPSSFEPEQDEG